MESVNEFIEKKWLSEALLHPEKVKVEEATEMDDNSEKNPIDLTFKTVDN